MAIKTETVTVNGHEFNHTYSDAGYLIERDGVTYDEAYDPIAYAEERVYTETDELVPTEEPTEEDYAAAARILLGVDD